MTNGQHESDPKFPDEKKESLEERLKIMEELVAQNSRTITLLEEQVTGHGARLAKDFRTKTHLTIPQIFLAAFHIDQNQHRAATVSTDDQIEYVSGSPESRFRTRNVSPAGEEIGGELNCWLPLLRSLHQNEWELESYGCYNQKTLPGDPNAQGQLVSPAVWYREMSWDFIPPAMVRPCAVTTASDIAILARRLGMLWEVFNPEGGSMRALGNGHGIFSVFTRPTGLHLQYTHLEDGAMSTVKSASPTNGRLSKAELYIPTREADMMGFGILPGCHRLNVPNMKVGTTAEVYATMDFLDSHWKGSTKLRNVNRLLVGNWDAHCMLYRFSDIIALAAPMIRGRHSEIVRVPMRAEYCSSLLSHKECFVAFHNRLKEYMVTQSSEQAAWILKQYEQLKSQYSEWENEAGYNNQVNGFDLDFLEKVHDCWDAATDYLVQQEKDRAPAIPRSDGIPHVSRCQLLGRRMAKSQARESSRHL